MQAYTAKEYRLLLAQSGFEEVRFFPALTGEGTKGESDFCVIVARKPGGGA
jgi:hypothetical protein